MLSRSSFYWAGRLTLTGDPDHLSRYDAAFAAYFGGQAPPGAPPRARRTAPPQLAQVAEEGGQGGEPSAAGPPLRALASPLEVLRHRDAAELSAAERDELARLLAAVALPMPTRASRRRAPARAGAVDPRRTLRRALARGGELTEVARRDAARRRRRVVLLVDVSGSMQPYADTLLRFAHAVVRHGPTTVEVFTVGTRLTRLTRELAHRDPERALAAASQAVPDWSGGTRLGEMLQAFLDRWGQRGCARGAVVVVFSDGWERGDPARLGAQAARLSRLAHRVVWATPHKARAGYVPATGGLQAVLPHLDALVAGHSMAALEQVMEVVCGA